MTDKVLVATYGSLRRLMGNHHVNNAAGGVVFGLGRTKEKCDLYEYCSGFPSVSLSHTDADNTVRVEVYETTEHGLTRSYDRLEGCYGPGHSDNFYDRSLVTIVMDDGTEVEAWIYHIAEQTGPLVKSGDWAVHKRGEEYYDSL